MVSRFIKSCSSGFGWSQDLSVRQEDKVGLWVMLFMKS